MSTDLDVNTADAADASGALEAILTVDVVEQWTLCDLIVTSSLGTLALFARDAAVDSALVVEHVAELFGLSSDDLLRPCGVYPAAQP